MACPWEPAFDRRSEPPEALACPGASRVGTHVWLATPTRLPNAAPVLLRTRDARDRRGSDVLLPSTSGGWARRLGRAYGRGATRPTLQPTAWIGARP